MQVHITQVWRSISVRMENKVKLSKVCLHSFQWSLYCYPESQVHKTDRYCKRNALLRSFLCGYKAQQNHYLLRDAMSLYLALRATSEICLSIMTWQGKDILKIHLDHLLWPSEYWNNGSQESHDRRESLNPWAIQKQNFSPGKRFTMGQWWARLHLGQDCPVWAKPWSSNFKLIEDLKDGLVLRRCRRISLFFFLMWPHWINLLFLLFTITLDVLIGSLGMGDKTWLAGSQAVTLSSRTLLFNLQKC